MTPWDFKVKVKLLYKVGWKVCVQEAPALEPVGQKFPREKWRQKLRKVKED